MKSAQQKQTDVPVAENAETNILVAGVLLRTDPLGVLFIPSESALVVADLHLEKGSRWAARGLFLPPWDTAATLERLGAALQRWRPKRVVALGDSFDDARAGERLSSHDKRELESLQQGRDWIWITGNHDPLGASGVAGEVADEIQMGGLRLRHEPAMDDGIAEIAGHLHPVAKVASQRGSVRRRCFVTDGHRCVMPAFGAYAGGLNIRDPVWDRVFRGRPRVAHVLGRTRVYRAALESCAADRRD